MILNQLSYFEKLQWLAWPFAWDTSKFEVENRRNQGRADFSIMLMIVMVGSKLSV